jgi:nucleoside-diphosphate-sugar epimerase
MRNNQIILGAGGSVGKALAKELKNYTNEIFLFSRNPKKVNEGDTLVKGSLLDTAQTVNALQNIDVAYLVVGLPYETKIWERDWMKLALNVLDGCIQHNVALVFLDNVYMYDPACFENLTEEAAIKSVSKKGAVRAAIANLLLEEMNREDIKIIIARSADFYGKDVAQSMFNEVIVKRILAGKKANWFIDTNKKHSLTLVDDAAKAIALLGNTNSAYNQVWHLPTDKAYTANELVQKISVIMDKPAKLQVASRKFISFLKWFIPAVKESEELLYQFERDYVFNSSKFQNTFGIKPTPIQKGLEEMIMEK